MAFDVDTRTAPEDARFEYWSEASSRVLLPLALSSEVQTPYAGRMWGEELGPLGVVGIAGDPLVVRRARAEIAAGDPEYVAVMLQRRGRSITIQDDRTVVLTPGRMVAYDSSREWTLVLEERFEVLSFHVSRALLGRQADALTRGPRNEASDRLVASLLLQIAESVRSGDATPGDEYLGESALALLRGLFSPPSQADATPRARARHGLLREIKRSIEASLGDPGLVVEDVARAHYVSRRGLYNLFASEGWGVQQWIRHRRLEGARRDLREPALRELSITDLATRWGFAGATQFARAFRGAYGCSPSAYRDGTAPGP